MSKKKEPEAEEVDTPIDKPPDDRVKELTNEARNYRVQRNQALRRAHAYETMLKAHNIDTSAVTEDKLSNLPIDSGKVDGSFEYAAPKPEVKKRATEKPVGSDTDDTRLTRADIDGMTHEEINSRWDEVKTFLKETG